MKYCILLFSFLFCIGCAHVSKKESKGPALPDLSKIWDFQDPAGTEQKFREILPLAEQSGDRNYYLQLLTQIARTQGLQRKFSDAHFTLDLVEKELEDAPGIVRIRYLLERGRVYNSSGEGEKSRGYFVEAWELGVAEGEDFYAVDAAHMMGIVEPPELQLEWAEKAMERAEGSKDPRARKWLGPLYNNTGWSYHDMKQYDRALELFEKSLAWRLEQGDEDGTRIARWTIGRIYRSLDRIDEALEIHLALEQERTEKGLAPDGYVFEELGECYLLKGEMDKAGIYFEKAFEILSRDEWLRANEPDRLERIKNLSKQDGTGN